jgi:hypothetical protein
MRFGRWISKSVREPLIAMFAVCELSLDRWAGIWRRFRVPDIVCWLETGSRLRRLKRPKS